MVHNGLGWNLSVYKSNNVKIENSVFVGSLVIGVHFDNVRSLIFDGNFVGDSRARQFNVIGMAVDKEACVAVCSYMTEGSPCYDMKITNNVAAGCLFAGFIAPGHDCDDNLNVRFRDNVAHSITGAGAGALIYPDPLGRSHSKCYELSHFSAYKTQTACVATHYSTAEMRAHDMTCIDSQKGISLQTAGESDERIIKFYDSHIFGETLAEDCPEGH